ncbi:MAG: glutamine-hydrolyzing carbamoyl-phosphate synthase small subunit [Eubacterium sp.]|nr:glutamine-hydrolyzing carbamoyl-phosphate synthase small subunit [Eubacterium sp.]
METGMKKIVLTDGSEYYGRGFGADRNGVCELVFNTSPVGYQEILSDPSYTDQFVVMAYPLIGNYGINEEDFETKRPSVGGLIVRDYNDHPSNFRSVMTLSSCMEMYQIPGISDVDTRELVRKIRNQGSQKALLTDADTDVRDALAELNRSVTPHDAVSRVSRKRVEHYAVSDPAFHVACVDFGMKENIIRSFLESGCSVTVFPWNVKAEEIKKCHPDGIFLSNGPGDPTDVKCAVGLVQNLKGEYPMFGICLGHQIMALACGAETYKLKFGHRGGNHPVRDLLTGEIEMTSQNHSYAVDEKSLSGTGLTVTHLNLLDGTVEGLKSDADRLFSVQYHPESAPGPTEGSYLFGRFRSLMGSEKHL